MWIGVLLPRIPSPTSDAGRLLVLAALALAGCDTSESPTAPTPPPSPSPEPGIVLLAGELLVPGALDRGDPGDHQVFLVSLRVRPDLGPTSGMRLVVTLRDLSRPAITCPSQEPEDGCATIDWSGDPAEPKVPADGLFVNRLRLELDSGGRDYYLSRSLRLNDVPDIIDPNREHTAVGGAPVSWDRVLPTDIVAGTDLELRLVLSKWQPPNVSIGYEVRLLEDSAAP